MGVRMTFEESRKLRETISQSPKTYEQLVAASGIKQLRLARWVARNRTDIHIASWAPDVNGRLFVPMWAWGAAPDAARPGRVLTAAEQMRVSRAKKKAAAC